MGRSWGPLALRLIRDAVSSITGHVSLEAWQSERAPLVVKNSGIQHGDDSTSFPNVGDH